MGGTRPFAFVFLGGTFPTAYSPKSDLVAATGIGVGNSYKNVGLIGIFNVNDVSNFKLFSASFTASRHIGRGTSMSVGAINVLQQKGLDVEASFYVALSHASQKLKSKTPGYSRLSYTVGVGTGRFNDKSPKDISVGKSNHGTLVFAGISYEIIKNVNVNAEWSGINAHFSFGWKPPKFSKNSKFRMPSINLGVADLFRTSGDHPRFIASIGKSFLLSKK